MPAGIESSTYSGTWNTQTHGGERTDKHES